jgi:hypothetical protein
VGLFHRAFGWYRSPALPRWSLQALLAHCGTQFAEIRAEAPDSGFEPRDPAQQDRGTEIGAHSAILSKSEYQSK